MTRSGFKGFIFDMDGTLLHTLPDLTALTNIVLEREGYPTRTEDEVRTLLVTVFCLLFCKRCQRELLKKKRSKH